MNLIGCVVLRYSHRFDNSSFIEKLNLQLSITEDPSFWLKLESRYNKYKHLCRLDYTDDRWRKQELFPFHNLKEEFQNDFFNVVYFLNRKEKFKKDDYQLHRPTITRNDDYIDHL